MNKDAFSELTVHYLPIDSLTAYPKNARSHSKSQIRQIAESIKAFSFTNPVLIASNNIIIAGHGRVAAAKLLGMDRVPTIRLEGLSDDEIRAYVIADNRLAEKAGWDKSILAIELQHLLTIDNDFDVTITGFEVPEIDLILEEAARKQDEDDVFDVDETNQPVAQRGDHWRLGKHHVLCGSALGESSYKALMVPPAARISRSRDYPDRKRFVPRPSYQPSRHQNNGEQNASLELNHSVGRQRNSSPVTPFLGF